MDTAGQPENRPGEPRIAKHIQYRPRFLQRLFAMGNDIRRWIALLADGVSAHDGDVPLDGYVARGIRDDERRQHPADCVADYTETLLAGGLRHAAHPVRAGDRALYSSGPAWPA